jgi:hypothetical protein
MNPGCRVPGGSVASSRVSSRPSGGGEKDAIGLPRAVVKGVALHDSDGTTVWPKGTIVTLDLASGVAYGQRAHQVCAGQRSWSTKANPG